MSSALHKMLPWAVLAASMLAPGCELPNKFEDRWGGGEATLVFDEASPITGSFTVAGAEVDCLKKSWCPDPHIALDSVEYEGDTSGVLQSWSLQIIFPLAASETTFDCFDGDELQMHTWVVIEDEQPRAGFVLDDPIASANEPNADQGGERAPSVSGGTEMSSELEPSLTGAIPLVFEIGSSRGACEGEDGGEVNATFEWDFDASVYDGPGYQTLP